MPLPPDAYAACAIGVALLLEWLVPVSILPGPSLLGLTTLAGFAITAAGFALEIAAARALAHAGASTRPNAAAAVLVTGGPFARSRNPFYCGLLLVLAGLFVGVGLDWGILVLPMLWLALDRLVVPFEEHRLERGFGQDYRDYAKRTARWIGL
jgi:protein-S-isoprenylcysteine O-methyltransferase Ste14